MIRTWVTIAISYFQLCDDATYVKPDEDLLLLRLDYIGFYFPRVFFHKFGYIKSLLTTSLPTESVQRIEVGRSKMVDMMDLSKDFLATAETGRIHYSHLPMCMYYLLMGEKESIQKFRELYVPLIPFFEFLSLDPEYLHIMTS